MTEILNKYSDTLHKPPSALLAGEVAVNRNAGSPGLWIKDTADNFRQIGGIKFGTTLPTGVYNPADPATYINYRTKGDLFWHEILKTWFIFTGTAWEAADLTKLNGVNSLTLSSAGNTNLSLALAQQFGVWNVTANAGAGGYTATLSLTATNAIAGAFITVNVALAASNNPRIQVRNLTSGGTLLDEAIGNNTARTVTMRFVFDGTNWSFVSRTPTIETFYFRRDTGAPAGATGSTGAWTWALPIRARWLTGRCINNGAGGGSGRRGAAGTNRTGGSGGQGGAIQEFSFPVGYFGNPGSNVTVLVPAGAAGGAAVTVNDTNGNNGSDSSSTGAVFEGENGNRCWASTQSAGAAGLGGNTGTSRAGGGVTNNHCFPFNGVFGGPSANVQPADVRVNDTNNNFQTGCGGGAGGGGIDTANTAYNGAGIHVLSTPTFRYRNIAAYNNTIVASVIVGGVAPGGNGQTPAPSTASEIPLLGGHGGTGGASSTSGAGGNGGNGQFPGGGGGGGGASVNGFNSGAGGNGADGLVYVACHY